MRVDALRDTCISDFNLYDQQQALPQPVYDDWILWIRDSRSDGFIKFMLFGFAESGGWIKSVKDDIEQQLNKGRIVLSETGLLHANCVFFCYLHEIGLRMKLRILADFAKRNLKSSIFCFMYCVTHRYSYGLQEITANSLACINLKLCKLFAFSIEATKADVYENFCRDLSKVFYIMQNISRM